MDKISPIICCSGRRGFGKTYHAMCDLIDYTRPVLIYDSRGQCAEYLNIKTTDSREEFLHQLRNELNPVICFRPGQDQNFDLVQDLDFFFLVCLSINIPRGFTLVVDEIDWCCASVHYPRSFFQIVDNSRSTNVTIILTGHRVGEFNPKLRALAVFHVFRTTSEGDRKFLRSFNDKIEVEETKNLPKYQFYVFPKDES